MKCNKHRLSRRNFGPAAWLRSKYQKYIALSPSQSKTENRTHYFGHPLSFAIFSFYIVVAGRSIFNQKNPRHS